MALRYHKHVVFQYGEKEMKLKVHENSPQASMEEAIRNRLGIANDQPIAAVDDDGCDVVLDNNMPSGTYKLVVLAQSNLPVAAKATSESKETNTEEPKATQRTLLRRNEERKVTVLIVDADITDTTIDLEDEVGEVASYTIMSNRPQKIDVQFNPRNNSVSKEGLEVRLMNWKGNRLEVVDWRPYDTSKENESLRARDDVKVTRAGPNEMRIKFPPNITGVFNYGEGLLTFAATLAS